MNSPNKPRLLMLTHRFPYPPNRGDRIRSYNLLRVLAEHCSVTLGCVTDEEIADSDREHVHELCEQISAEKPGRFTRYISGVASFAHGNSLTEGMFRSTSLQAQINHWQQVDPFDAVLVFCSSMYPYIDNERFAETNTIVDLVDVDSQKWKQMADETSFPKRMIYRAEATRVRRLEQKIAQQADAVALVSDSEAELYRSVVRIPTGTTIKGISNGVDTSYFHPAGKPQSVTESAVDPTKLTKLVFTGVLDYPPNTEGMIWFCHQVFPQLQRLGNFQLSIVGRRPIQQVRELGNQDGVIVEGEVPDVRPYLHAADIAISPLKLARGIQNKVLEAMATALPVVLTTQSSEGIDARSGHHFEVADSVAEWIDAITTLANDPITSRRLGCRARQLVEEQYSWSSRLMGFTDLIASPGPPVRDDASFHPQSAPC